MNYDFRGDPILGPVLAYWARKRGSRLMPCKRDIDPVEIPSRLLPHLQIIEVIDAGARFRYRLVGGASVQAHGQDYTGKYPDEMLPDDRVRLVLKIYQTVYRTKSPLFSRSRYYSAKGWSLFANRVYMPLSDDEENVQHILGTIRFESGIALDSGTWSESRLDPSEQYIEPIEVTAPTAA